MKKKWLLALLAGATMVALTGCGKDVTVHTGGEKVNVVTVEGVAEIEVTPDVAYLLLTVETKDEVSTVAKDTEAKTSKSVLEALKKAGLSDKVIETKNYQIHQYRDYLGMVDGKEQTKEIYHVSHQLKVTIDDIAKVSEVLEAVAGKNFVQISSISYDVKEKESHIQEAMKQATKNAEARAKAVAEAAGTSVKSLNSVTTLASQSVYGTRMAMDMAFAEKSEQTPINPETQTIQITVQATFNTK